jgi:hypothetical protein
MLFNGVLALPAFKDSYQCRYPAVSWISHPDTKVNADCNIKALESQDSNTSLAATLIGLVHFLHLSRLLEQQ